MKLRIAAIALVLVCILSLVFSCKHQYIEKDYAAQSNYPPGVAKIIMTKCVDGCHNDKNAIGAAGLRLDTWEHLFNGGTSGAFVVPYRPEYSPLLYFINTDSSLGPVLVPTMPYNGSALTRTEYLTIKNWIENGAPDKDGNIPFGSHPETRQKIYVAHQNSDEIAVIDAEKRVVMRYIHYDRGTPPQGAAHNIKFSDDGRYAYLVLYGGTKVLKIDASADKVTGEFELNQGAGLSWNVCQPYANGTKLLVSKTSPAGSVASVNTSTGAVSEYAVSSELSNPHGIAVNRTNDTAIITGQVGNTMYKLPLNFMSPTKKILINTNASAPSNPHEVVLHPDYSRYYISCQSTNDIRVMDAYADTLIRIIPVGSFPQELAVSRARPYLFVTCLDDEAGPGAKGSLYVINYNTYDVVKIIKGDFFQPHGVTVDDRNDMFYVTSINDAPDAPPAHHATSGNIGWYQAYRMTDFKRITGRCETLKNPYSADVRFK